MNPRILGVYREVEFSPGKVEADAAIIDAVLAELGNYGAGTATIDAAQLSSEPPPTAHMVLAMCQGEPALSLLAPIEKAGAVTINAALSIRNSCRDLCVPSRTPAA